MPPGQPDFAAIPPWSAPTTLVMERSPPLRTPIAAPAAVPPAGTLPGSDAGRDSALYYAAVGIFALAGIAVLGLAGGLWLSRGAGPEPEDTLFSFDPGFSAGVALDAPVLRPGFGAADSIVVFDGATGQSEVMSAPPALDAADTALLGREGGPLLR